MINQPRTVALFLLLFFSPVLLPAQEKEHTEDHGANDLNALVQHEIGKARAQLEKQLPPLVQKQILAAAKAQANRLKGEYRVETLLQVANEYKRLRFTAEATQLYDKAFELSSHAPSKVLAKRSVAEIEYVANNDIHKAIQNLDEALEVARAGDHQNSIAEVLIEKGSYHFINEEPKQMRACYDAFIALPTKTKANYPRKNLKANLYNARLTLPTQKQVAQKYFANVREILSSNPEEIEPDLVLSLYLEAQDQTKPWNDPAFIEQLQELFDSKKYADEPELFDVGNHIFWALFLNREEDPDQFEEFANSFIQRLDDQFEKLNRLDDSNRNNVVVVACQCIGGYAFFCDEEDLKFNKSEYQERLEGWLKQRRENYLNGRFPSRASRQERGLFADAVKKGTVDVLEIDVSKPGKDEKGKPTPATPKSKQFETDG